MTNRILIITGDSADAKTLEDVLRKAEPGEPLLSDVLRELRADDR